MKQENVFLKSEGDAWLERNRKHLLMNGDPVLDTISHLVGFPTQGKCLEIGCSNGWRLKEIERKYGLEPFGIDPGSKAVKEARTAGVTTLKRVACDIAYPTAHFDVVIYGFCLYLCSRNKLFRAIAEGDRVLKNNGLMIVYDFDSYMPCKNPYKHKEGMWSYKQDYARMFMASPAYVPIFEKSYLESETRGATMVVVMRKDIERGWPLCE